MPFFKKLFGKRDKRDILVAFELLSVDGVKAALDEGLDATAPIHGKPLVNWLTEMYSRGDAFPSCLRLLLEHGAVLDDPKLEPVLLDEPERLRAAIESDPSLLTYRTTMVSTFTPLTGASLLHVAAEYGNAAAAKVLIEVGADVNAPAAVDEHGLNGHTPIFHTVNSSHNRSAAVMTLLLDAGGKSDTAVKGITWGRGFDWETTIFDVTPISYAQFGLLPQMHRRDADIYDNVRRLLAAAGRSVPPLDNIPNRYLKPKAA